jgi:hypothetical protein
VERLVATLVGPGDLVISETDDIALQRLKTTEGSISVNAGGRIDGAQVTAGSDGDVILQADGPVTATVTADYLAVRAAGAMVLTTTVDSLEAETTAAGDIVISETDAVALVGVQTLAGAISVTAGGSIDAAQVIAGSDGDVTLQAAGSVTATVTAADLTVSAAGDILLSTAAARLKAESSGAGQVTVTEADDIELIAIRAADGVIAVTAGGTIRAFSVISETDAVGNDVNLTSFGGDVLIDYIQVGKASGGVVIVADGDIREIAPADADVDVAGSYADISLGGKFGSTAKPELNLELDLSRFIFFGQDLVHDFTGDVELNIAASGIIDVTATGTVTVVYMASGGGEITLASIAGDIVINFMDAGAAAGTVKLVAADSIFEAEPADDEVDLIASAAYLEAGVTIGGGSDTNRYLETAVGTLIAELGGSSIYLNEVDDIELASIVALDGEIDILAGGDITISGPVTTGPAAGHIRLQAGGELYMTGTAPTTTDYLEARAHAGIFLRTQVATLDARIEGRGIIEIREIDDVILRDVTNADGSVYVTAGGEITAGRVESLADAKGNNVGLMSLGGDVVVDFIGVGLENGQISLSSAGNIREAEGHDADVDLQGALGIIYAKGRIDRSLDASFKKSGRWCKKSALYQFEHGRPLNLSYLEGDVELFFDLDNRVHIYATGDVRVTYLDTNGHDIYLRSKYGDIYIDYINSGPGRGDIELSTADSVYLAAELYSGDSGQITAGDDLSIYAGDGIQIFGNVSAGDDIKMVASRGEVYLGGSVSAADRIDIYANEDLIITAALTAGSDLDLYAKGSLTTTNASATLTAGMDIELWAAGQVALGAAIAAGDDVEIDSLRGGVEINGAVAAGDRIDINAGENLVITAALTAGNELSLYARNALTTTSDAALTAGADVKLKTCRGDIELRGAVTAGAKNPASSGGKHCRWYKPSPDVRVDAGGSLSIYGAITSVDDIDLYSRSDLRLFGTVRAGDDFYAYAQGDIEVSAGIEAFDRIHLSARGDLTLSTSSSLSGINGEPARYVCLHAGHRMTLDGTINTKKYHY